MREEYFFMGVFPRGKEGLHSAARCVGKCPELLGSRMQPLLALLRHKETSLRGCLGIQILRGDLLDRIGEEFVAEFRDDGLDRP